jgi:hypothetical protein
MHNAAEPANVRVERRGAHVLLRLSPHLDNFFHAAAERRRRRRPLSLLWKTRFEPSREKPPAIALNKLVLVNSQCFAE